MITAKNTTSPWQRHILLLPSSLGVLIIDQLSKLLVKSFLLLGDSFPGSWPVRFTHVHNSGIAFGIKANQFILIFVTAIVVILLLILSLRFHPFKPRLVQMSLGLVLGGAVGNLTDRIRLGYVTDFIDFQVWPVFNIADSAVVVGVGILIYYFLFHSEARQQSQD